MKNTFKVLSLIAMVAIIGLTMTACGDPGDDGVAKKIQITGVDSLNGKRVTIGVADTKGGKTTVRAVGQGDVTKSTFTISLKSNAAGKQGENYTGTAEVYIYAFVDVSDPTSLDDDLTYIYTGDGDDSSGQKIATTEATTTLAWADFKPVS